MTPCMSPVPRLGRRALTVASLLPSTNGVLDWGCQAGVGVTDVGCLRTLAPEGPPFGDVAVESLALMSPWMSSVPGGALGDGSRASLGCDTPAVALAVP